MGDGGDILYDDGGVVCDREGLLIRRYYPWGAKRIRYASIDRVSELPLAGVNKVRKWRVWGSGDFVHWWNLDPRRPEKELALVIHTGSSVLPTITPEDPERVLEILERHLDG